jgi:hypothetical protein
MFQTIPALRPLTLQPLGPISPGRPAAEKSGELAAQISIDGGDAGTH